MPRNVNGEYELPAGNPVVSGTIISTNWANDTMADLATALTNSLSRNGNGGMLAPFLNADGSESAPGIAWSNEPSTGFWRAGPQDMRASVSALATQRWNEQGSQLWRNGQWEEILTNSGGGGGTTINNLVVTGSFTSPGIDDNATSTAITIDANENVGVGNPSPSHRLDIVDTGTVALLATGGANGYIRANAPTSQAGFSLAVGGTQKGVITYDNSDHMKLSSSETMRFVTGVSEAMRIDDSGNVLIGDTTSYLSAANRKVLHVTGGSDGSILGLKGTTGDFYIHSGGSGYTDVNIVNRANGNMTFLTDNTEAMRIDSTGNVGIGTSTTSIPQKLCVEDTATTTTSTYIQVKSGIEGNAGIAFGDTDADLVSGVLFNNDDNALRFFKSGFTEAMRIASDGSVGIGTTQVSSVLDIGSPDDTVRTHIGLGPNKSNYFTSGASGEQVFRAGTEVRMIINNAGSVGIGTGAVGSGALLDVSSTAANTSVNVTNNDGHFQIQKNTDHVYLNLEDTGDIIFRSGVSVQERLRINNSGNLTATGNVTAYSDERLKDNVETLDGSKVYDMRGVSFTKDGEAGSGVIAQELQMVAPELVHEGGEYLSVAYGNLVGYLIEAVKDLKAEVEELKRAK